MMTTLLLIALGQTGAGGGGAFGDVGGDNTVGAAGSTATGSGTCVGTDSVLRDNNGDQGCQNTSGGGGTPQDYMIRPQVADPAGTVTAADVNIFPGQDSSLVRIDAADPSATCPGDTVTVTRYDSNNSSTASVLTHGTEWSGATTALACTSLATAIDALSGVGATCTSPNVFITMDAGYGAVTLAESDGNCTGATTGTQGVVRFPAMGGGGAEIVTTAATATIIRSLGTGSMCLGYYSGSIPTSGAICAASGALTFTDAAGGYSNIGAAGSSGMRLRAYTTSSTNPAFDILNDLTTTSFNGSSGTQVFADISTTINQTSTASFNLLQADVTSSTVGSGTQNFLYFADDTVQKFSVSLGGLITAVASGGSDLTAGSCTVGQMALDTGGVTDEWCVCGALNSWSCVTATAGGPVD